MIDRNALTGIFPAYPTPTTTDGSIDGPALRRLVDYLVESGAHGLVPIGGTGEFTALSPRQRIEVVEISIEAAAGRVPVIPGVLSPGYAEAVEAGQAFHAAGAAALMLITPFYVTPSQEGVRDYFKRYRADVAAPLLLYDIPVRTRTVVEPETIARLVEDGSVIGMKACNADINHFNQTAALVADRMAILSGEDTHFPVHMTLGATGGVLATATVLPRKWVEIYDLSRNGRVAEAVAAQRALLPLINILFSEPNPGPLKEMLRLVGLDSGTALAPLRRPSEATLHRLESVIRDLRAAAVL